MAESVTGEARMLIDGELVEAASGARYDNVNPATEEVIGQTADAAVGDMERAIAAARRAFEESDWAHDPELRKRSLRQLQEALAKEREVLRPLIVAEVGTPIMLTYAVQMDSCIDDMEWDIECIDRIDWEYDLPAHEFFGMRSARRVLREPIGVVGAITPWNFPFMLNLSKIVPALAAGNTRRPEARAGHTVERDAHRPHRSGVHGHPGRSLQRRHVERPGGRRRGAECEPATST